MAQGNAIVCSSVYVEGEGGMKENKPMHSEEKKSHHYCSETLHTSKSATVNL